MEREDFLKFQIKEIEDADITADEDSALQDEKKVLNNAKKLSELARESHDILYAGENAVLEKLTRIIHDVEEIRNIDTRFEISGKDLETIFFSLEDVSFRIRDYGNRITFSPERLETIEDRLEYLGRLKRKYGSSLGDILRKKEELRDELEGISSVEEDIQKLSQGVIAKKEVLLEKAVQLSKKRKEVASQLKREIEGEIHTLRMKNTVFEARFNESHDDSVGNPVVNWRGIDDMEFYLSTNIGEELKPMNRIASGGELSRIVLAMKKVLARTGSVSTIIFDEVDTGIGGATAEIVGKKLQEVSDHHQVICISHLPQIVCFGDNHFLVAKKVTGERTNTEVRVLAHEERLEEITRMLGGVHVTEKTREHAHEMLKAAHDSTGTME
jgi:DNA repair protein RecN (Recombination protein N)